MSRANMLALVALVTLTSPARTTWVPSEAQLPLLGEPRWQQQQQQQQQHSTPSGRRLEPADAASTGSTADVWPYGPFETRGRDIVNSRGEVVTWAGVNWPLSLETMIPEGLEFASADSILDDLASVGFNFVRMGYAYEMVDQIYDRAGQDVPLDVSMIMGLGLENGTRVTSEVIKHNPTWTASTTRFEMWSDIVHMAYQKGLFVHPDLHIGKAMWCCSHTDGGSWFDDTHFSTAHWHRALAYIATWARPFPNIVSMSLRNELRESWADRTLVYNWRTHAGNMSAGADTIHAANPDLLITWGGMQFGQDLSALTTAAAAAAPDLAAAPCYRCDADHGSPVRFDADARPWGRARKLVWELHLYNVSEDVDTGGSCGAVAAALCRNGMNALGIAAAAADDELECAPAQRLTPVILSEFGQTPEDGSIYANGLLRCLRALTTEHRVSWAMWSLAGYFRIRQGVQGFVDPKGMFNATFDGWHDADVVENWWRPWVRAMNVTKKG